MKNSMNGIKRGQLVKVKPASDLAPSVSGRQQLQGMVGLVTEVRPNANFVFVMFDDSKERIMWPFELVVESETV
jgi:hypothetical protein